MCTFPFTAASRMVEFAISITEGISGCSIACETDSKCIGIYENFDSEEKRFRLCQKGFISSYKSKSVIHQKKKLTGKKLKTNVLYFTK